MVATSLTKPCTSDEYLALEVQSDIRHEYRNGEIVPMTGGTPAHNRLSSALNALLWIGLRNKPYSVFVTDQRLWLPEVNLYTYPDVMVLANPIELKPDRKDTVMNAILIAEMLSDSTAAYDRGDKFAHYRTMETFQEYVLIHQDRPWVEHYVKQSGNQWLFTEYVGLEASFTLATVDVAIALIDLYDEIEFEVTQQ